jgi:16S rRNA (guanine527-N7)-methyltransferase
MEALEQFCALVLEGNKTQNLVSKNDAAKLWTRHIEDSLTFLKAYQEWHGPLDESGEWLDMGSGAGFPVIPLALSLPAWQFYAVEPRKKRCDFLWHVKTTLKLSNLKIIEDKVENSDFDPVQVVSCRALGSIEEDWARAKELLAPGGWFITAKSVASLEPTRIYRKDFYAQLKLFPYQLQNEEQNYVMAGRQ